MADNDQQIDFFCIDNHMEKPVSQSSPKEIAEAIEGDRVLQVVAVGRAGALLLVRISRG